jgi:hypothetical protein
MSGIQNVKIVSLPLAMLPEELFSWWLLVQPNVMEEFD